MKDVTETVTGYSKATLFQQDKILRFFYKKPIFLPEPQFS